MTLGTETNEVIGLIRIALKTTAVGTTEFASIEMIIEEKTFHSSVIVGTKTKIEIIAETETRAIGDADVMVSDGRRLFRECPSVFASIDRRNLCSTVNREDLLVDRNKVNISQGGSIG